MLIAHISDIHLKLNEGPDDRFASGRALDRAVKKLLSLSPMPDLILLTGDCTEHGTQEEYEALSHALAKLPAPVYLVPGNHDRREPMRCVFQHLGYLPSGGPLNYVVESRPVRIVALDTLVEGESHGELSELCLSFLDAALTAEAGVPTLVMLHHPPFSSGLKAMDRISLRNSGAFREIIARHPQVERVLSGHVHRSIQAVVGGTLCQVAPSLLNAVAADFGDGGSVLKMVSEPSAFLTHLWHDARLVTHLLYVD